MASRLELQQKLEDILGSRNVYYNPPESLKLNYPAIIYRRTNIKKISADNSAYDLRVEYQMILVEKNPDSPYVLKLAALPLCRHTTAYKADGLNHDIFSIFY